MNGKPLTLLLIEDNEDHAELVIRCFEDQEAAVRIHHAQDGDLGIRYLFGIGEYADRTAYPIPELILLDLRIPKVDGLEVLRRIKEAEDLKHIPIVVLTSSENDRDVITAYRNYANSYLVKPVDFKRFSEMMRELGFYWFNWNRGPATEHHVL